MRNSVCTLVPSVHVHNYTDEQLFHVTQAKLLPGIGTDLTVA